MRTTINDLANSINDDANTFKYFWAYGLIRETYSIWQKEENKKLLNEAALSMLECAEDDPLTNKSDKVVIN